MSEACPSSPVVRLLRGRLPRSLLDHSRDFLWMRLIHCMARAFDFERITMGARVVPALEIRVDDFITSGDHAPARLRLPRGSTERGAEHLDCSEHLRACHEFGLL